jgi:phage tail sheath protein FI
MAPFNAVGKAPGVYVQEIAVAGPIAGVGTSTAAFVGPARSGPINKPTLLNNWSQFVNKFGVQDDFGPYIITPPVFVTHAVRGFFDNGGAHCYFVRVGTAKRSKLDLVDAGGNATLTVQAKDDGSQGDALNVEVKHANAVSGAKAVRADVALTSAAANEAIATTNSEAQKLRPGDQVLLEEGANKEQVTVDHVSGATITFRSVLANAYTNAAKMRIADLKAGGNPVDTKIRFSDTTGIEAGSYVTIKQGANVDKAVVATVNRANNAITLRASLAHTYTMATADPDVTLQTEEFTLLITQANPPVAEVYSNLSLDPAHPKYFAPVVAASPTVEITLSAIPNPSAPPDNLPAVLAATPLAGGANDDVSQITSVHYQNGIDALKNIDDVNILCVPDRTDASVQSMMISHCENMQDRFAILDPRLGATPSNGILTQRNGLQTSDGGFAALYYPRILINNPLAEGLLLVPPSGHIAGVYARVDDSRGVHKAPANEGVRGVLGLEQVLSDADQGPLNDLGINVIRSFPRLGIRVWGARTISTRTQWRYVNVRRLLLFLEESIQEGTQFAVFEPNDLSLRQKVVRIVTDFLTRAWRDGALFGATAEDAFRVRADEELNPPDLRALGQLVIEVIVVPTTPAEFIVFQIIQDPTGAALKES